MYDKLVKDVRATFQSGKTQSIEWRRRQLEGLLRLFDVESEALVNALQKDLKKPKMEALGMEIGFDRNEVVGALNNLEEWTKPEMVKKDLLTMMDTCYIRPEPLGVILIMGAWNYPVQLIFHPLVGAIAAGNCVVIKPSELSEHTAKLIEQLVPKYLDNDAFKVVNGGIPETTALLKERFDHILYTGNSAVAKIVMTAAAKYLTPVTLELGGKSPCYVDKSSDLDIAARRISWGRFANAGQTCIAPDYVLCQKEVQDKLIPKIRATVEEFYGQNPQESKDFGRIVNDRHFKRVKNLVSSTSGEVIVGGQSDEADKYISPTVIANCKDTDAVMQEEIFGPVLPVMPVQSAEEAINFIQSREKPLAMYVYSKDKAVTDRMISGSTSGSILVNDCLLQGSLPTLPFGGVGNSGTGSYHGKFSFDAFSHKRACMIKAQSMESVNSIRYPPYTEKKEYWLTTLMKRNPKKRGILGKIFPLVFISILLAAVFKALKMEDYLPAGVQSSLGLK